MKMIKNPAPNFYEAACFKCGCTYMYQFNVNYEYLGIFKKRFLKDQPLEKVYTICPNCQEKIQHPSLSGGLSTGMGFAK